MRAFRVEEILEKFGVRAWDTLRGEEMLLADLGLSKTAYEGAFAAARVIDVGLFSMTTGAPLPVGPEAARKIRRALPRLRMLLPDDGRPDPAKSAELSAFVLRACLADPYATYYRLLKACEDDPNVERKKAAKALARFLRLHPHNIAQKTEVMVEHFESATRHKIGGRAKAMVLTGSRLEAVRYKQSFDRYIQEKGYPIKSLVAFSGTVEDDKLPGVTYTEEKMNEGVREKQLPEQFATQDYRVLLVAEKYQTGFDQPLLHTMYVDKRLAGIQAVQTLSRLNRIHPLKEDTFVLDFVNDRDEIREAFKTYYEGAELGEEVDPARMYVIKGELDASGIYLDEEVERFSAVYFKPRQRQSALDHQAMNAVLDPAVSRFTALQGEDEDEAELWRGKVQAFRNLYGFLSQVIPYQDSDLERLHVYLRHLAAKLRRRSGPAYQFDDDVRLEYYRLQKISEGSISLGEGTARALDGPTEVGSGAAHEQPVLLSQLIDVVNERFGTDFNEADQLFFDQIVEAAVADDGLRQAAAVNPENKFELVFKNLLDRLFIERIDQNEEIFVRYMNDEPFQQVVSAWMASEAYRRLRAAEGRSCDTEPGVAEPQGLRFVEARPEERYVTCVPLVPLDAAAGVFSDPQHVEADEDWQWVAVDTDQRIRPGMFVAQIVGKSMEPTVPDGAYGLFRAPVEGTRQGKTVLVQLRDATDPETGASFTVKRYESEKARDGDSWRHARITLKPINPDFEPIVIMRGDEGEIEVVAELVEVIPGTAVRGPE